MKLSLLWLLGVVFVATWVLIRWQISRSSALRLLDQPNQRSLHDTPTPTGAGIPLVVCALTAWLGVYWWSGGAVGNLGPLMIAAFSIGVVSLFDDLRNAPVLLRLSVHGLVGLYLSSVFMAGSPTIWPGFALVAPSYVLSALVAVFVVWMINLYNFMDGMDGFAGGMGLVGFAALALIARGDGPDADLYVISALVVVAACAAFLYFNFPPARIFLGDTGSSVLGLSAATFILWGQQAGHLSWWLGVLVFSPFVVDATYTLLRRALKGERIWEAHRSHCYQRLVLGGWSHKKTVLWSYSLMVMCAISAVLASDWSVPAQQWLLLGWVAIYITIIVCIQLRLPGR